MCTSQITVTFDLAHVVIYILHGLCTCSSSRHHPHIKARQLSLCAVHMCLSITLCGLCETIAYTITLHLAILFMTFDLQGSIYQHGVVLPLIYTYTNHTGHIAEKKNMRMHRIRDELVSDVMRGMSPERETVHA